MPAPNVKDFSPAPGHAGSTSASGSGTKAVESWVHNAVEVSADTFKILESHVAETTQPSFPSVFLSPEQRIKQNSSSQANVESGGGISSGTLKNENVSRKALDKLWSIYAAGNTVPIPFLRQLIYHPSRCYQTMCLDAGSGIMMETLLWKQCRSSLQVMGKSKKGRSRQNEVPLPPSVYQRLTSSPTLMNLAQALAYHKMCYEEMPLQDLQVTQEQQTIQNLCDTLRTILRL